MILSARVAVGCVLFLGFVPGSKAQQGASAVALTISPATASVTVGEGQQFTATMQDGGGAGVRWTVGAPAGSVLSPGTITKDGAYQTPFPAPPSVVITATSVVDPTVHASAVVTLKVPAVSAGPALRVDTEGPTHRISPLIYGMNSYSISPQLQATVHVPVDRWGGDAVTRWNWKSGHLECGKRLVFRERRERQHEVPGRQYVQHAV